MEQHRVLITTSYLEPGDEVHRLLTEAGCTVLYSRPQDRNGGLSREAVAEVDAIIAGTEPLTAELIEGAPELRIIVRTGAGYDNVDVEAATRRGVVVCTTPGVNRQSVAELTVGLLLDCARGISASTAQVRAGAWVQKSGRELSGSTLGVIGLGAIGKEVASVAQALGMTVLAHDPALDPAYADEHAIASRSFEDLLRESDFVTLHIALSPATYRMIDREAIAAMKPGAFLINTARGGVVDEQALGDALTAGHLAGAALDVLETEPLPAEHPLRHVPNLVITPHIAAATVQSRARSGLLAAAQVLEYLHEGRAAHLVPESRLVPRLELERQ
ncbi:hydroxyacid dehydrogenase [Ornithinimicrobium humiphilum]|uniref:D-3-phosphoglycerate dehydrogenase/(S)-sulfolactate dehydrogenase n=1 Tax=Ornithinimicrobium humiphilum TaxID=125288 RepID=A0A543KQL4_9MICO|nr:phosphoglycerate dehydrogenase [Ornithinimicrobium humiphilum]TQM97334.1 D-3-phosphoglycerate dehydrogenase/(S)-sulfolactate dehydrogenase [Ornithinimicrobium humiphilum]